MEDYFSFFAAFVFIGQSVARNSDSAFLVLGGGSHIYIDSFEQSPVLQSFEIFGCPRFTLPNYPREVFGANMIWSDKEQEEGLLVCGGADWKMTFKKCHFWNPR